MAGFAAGLSLAQKPPAGARLRAGHPLAQGLVLALPLNEGGGLSVYDASGNGNTCTLTQSSGTAPTWGSGPYGTSLYIANTNQSGTLSVSTGGYVNIPNASSLNLSSGYTVHSVSRQTSTSKQTAGIVDKNRNHAFGFYYEQSSNKIAYNHVGTEAIKSGYNLNQWYAVTGAWDGATQKLYVDGSLIVSQANSSAITNGDAMSIGRLMTDNDFFLYGNVSHVYFYNRALSAAEVQQLYIDPFCFMQPRRGQILSFPVAPAAQTANAPFLAQFF